MQIIRLPVLSDNYIFLLHDPQRNIAAVVDPAEAQPVLEELAKLKAELVAIFNTHHHGDHVGGNTQLMQSISPSHSLWRCGRSGEDSGTAGIFARRRSHPI